MRGRGRIFMWNENSILAPFFVPIHVHTDRQIHCFGSDRTGITHFDIDATGVHGEQGADRTAVIELRLALKLDERHTARRT